MPTAKAPAIEDVIGQAIDDALERNVYADRYELERVAMDAVGAWEANNDQDAPDWVTHTRYIDECITIAYRALAADEDMEETLSYAAKAGRPGGW